ncbi:MULTISPECIES: SDR family oxidoreductase [Methylobacterium]|uniref:SDR family oxidoreductase n=1 Tax=Methylobacterium TaxID=407 RepID=UPI0013E9C0D0|nr:SDR family NAD(P)-dependent oxidoreductase [Methylobacterium sp. DB0501]NGM36358.1 SDR family NAD(P)-dependent oxidoreductase [Methylobacterium sp. DB0501]
MTETMTGKIAWVTGAGSGIGEAAALALAGAGARIVLTGRREEPLRALAERIAGAGGEAVVEPGDVTDSGRIQAIVAGIAERFGRLDVLVSNAGSNVRERRWDALSPEDAQAVIAANLSSAFYASLAVLPLMRAQGDGVLIHTASWAGRFVSPVSGPAYTAAKHAVVAMSHSINMEECVNGIRSTVLCPAEVATPILDKRPVPVSAEDRARMLQPEDMAALILFVATRPKHVCLNEVVISPTWNRGYVPDARLGSRLGA